MHCTPSLRSFPNVAFETVPMLLLSTMALSQRLKMSERFFLCFSLPPPFPQAIDSVMSLALYPQVVSSSSTFQIFRDASHLRWLLCPPFYLLGHFLGLRHASALAAMDFGLIQLGKLAGSWQGSRLWHFSCTLDTERSSSTDGSRNYKDKKKHRPKSVSFAVNLYSKANTFANSSKS